MSGEVRQVLFAEGVPVEAADQLVTLAKNNFLATVDPVVGDDSDDGYASGSVWVNLTDDKTFICVDATVGAAVWNEDITSYHAQELTNKDIDGGTASNTSRVTIPKNTTVGLDALTDKEATIAYDTDLNTAVVNNGSTWTQLGGGAGGINYIENPDAETSTTDGWTIYADAAGEAPVDGEGGAPTITFTRITTDQLRGIGSFRITKDAANRQGEGVAYEFELDKADAHSMMRVSFDANTSANYVDGDAKIYVIHSSDNFAADFNVEQVIDLDLLAGESGRFEAEYQTPASNTDVRLVIHIASTNANAYTIDIDNVQFGPTSYAAGAVITGWEAYTPVVQGFGTVTGVDFFQRRNGENLEVFGILTTGTNGVTEAQIGLPSGLSINTTSVSSIRMVGDLARNLAAANNYNILATGGDTYFNIGREDSGGGLTPIVGNLLGVSAIDISMFASVPIEGWGGTVQMSENTSTRAVDIQYSSNGGEAITANVTDIPFSTKEIATHAAWNGSKFTAPFTGLFPYEGGVYATPTSAYAIEEYIDGVQNRRVSSTLTTTSNLINFSGAVYLLKGQELSFRSTNSYSVTASSVYHWLAIYSQTGNQTIAASEKIYFRGENTAGTSISNSAQNLIPLTVVNDSHAAYDTGTDIFTIPRPGWYDWTMKGGINSFTANTGRFNIELWLDTGSGFNRYDFAINEFGTETSVLSSVCSGGAYLNKGDKVKMEIWQSNGTARSLNNGAGMNVFTISSN